MWEKTLPKRISNHPPPHQRESSPSLIQKITTKNCPIPFQTTRQGSKLPFTFVFTPPKKTYLSYSILLRKVATKNKNIKKISSFEISLLCPKYPKRKIFLFYFCWNFPQQNFPLEKNIYSFFLFSYFVCREFIIYPFHTMAQGIIEFNIKGIPLQMSPKFFKINFKNFQMSPENQRWKFIFWRHLKVGTFRRRKGYNNNSY